jgi:hypothetical protein
MLQRTLTALITSALLGAMLLIAPAPTVAVRATGLTVDIYNAPSNPSGMTRPWIDLGLYTYCTQVTGVPNLDLFFADEMGDDDAPYGTDCQSDNVLAHYTGTLSLPVTGEYQFYNASDDGLRVLLDSTQVLYDWTTHGTFDDCFYCYGPTTTLDAGSYSFDAWWFDGCCGAGVFLQYSLNGGAWTTVPPEWFGPPAPAAGSTISSKAPNMLAAQPRSGVANASYLWYRCTLPGSESTSLPKNCRSTGVTSKYYRVTLQDKRSGYLRVFVRAGRDRYYSEAWSLSPVK